MTADRLIRKLQIVDENVLAEAVEQPMLFVLAARYRVEKMRRRVRAEAELESFDAMESLRIRARREGERLPLDYFKQRLAKNSRHKVLLKQVHLAQEREELSKLLLEAFRQRRDAIKILADHLFYEGNKEVADVERDVFNRKMSIEARRLQSKRRRLE